MRSKIPICLVTVVALTGAGCIDSRTTHYYTITPPTAAAIQSRADGPILVVGNVTTPVSLQDGRIHYRAASNEVGGYDLHRWTERPGTMVRDSLARALRASGRYQRVMEASGSAVGDYIVSGRLREFGEVDGASIRTRISLQVDLVDEKTNRNVWDHLTEREEPVSGRNVADVVQSLDRNLQQVVNDAAGEIDKFLAARR